VIPVARLVLASLLRGRRAVFLGLLCLLAGCANLSAQAMSTEYRSQQTWALVAEELVLTQVLAFVSLLLAASALGDLREDATILYLASTPRRRIELVLGAWLAATIATLTVLSPALAIQVVEGVVVSEPVRANLAVLGAACLAAGGYAALFLLLSLIVRRAVVAGLAYLAFWELSIASIAKSGSYVSISAHGRNLVHRAVEVDPPSGLSHAPMAALGSIVVVVLGAAGLLALAAWRLGRAELP
jgi:ABC-2 type transport system permease protein